MGKGCWALRRGDGQVCWALRCGDGKGCWALRRGDGKGCWALRRGDGQGCWALRRDEQGCWALRRDGQGCWALTGVRRSHPPRPSWEEHKAPTLGSSSAEGLGKGHGPRDRWDKDELTRWETRSHTARRDQEQERRTLEASRREGNRAFPVASKADQGLVSLMGGK